MPSFFVPDKSLLSPVLTDFAETARYLGYKRLSLPDEQISQLINESINELFEVLRPQAVYEGFELERFDLDAGAEINGQDDFVERLDSNAQSQINVRADFDERTDLVERHGLNVQSDLVERFDLNARAQSNARGEINSRADIVQEKLDLNARCDLGEKLDSNAQADILPLIQFADVKIHSKDLGRNLSGCDRVVLLAATIGPQVDAVIRRQQSVNPAKAAVMQAAGAMYIEKFVDLVNDEIKNAAGEGESFKPRYSPGFGDVSLEVQKDFFRLLPCARIGLTLMDSLIMSPEKSVTAFVGSGSF